jgi:pentatricopeptide repeat protein
MSSFEFTTTAPDAQLYTTVITACTRAGQWQRAVEAFDEMQQKHGVKPSRYTYNAVLNALCKGGQWRQALDILAEMTLRGCSVTPDVVTYCTVMNCCSRNGQGDRVLGLWRQMIAAGVKPTGRTYGSAIDSLQRAYRTAEADELYYEAVQCGALNHWYAAEPNTLDFHFNPPLCSVTGLRCILASIVELYAASSSGVASSSSSTSSTDSSSRNSGLKHDYDMCADLQIITGHNEHRDGQRNAVLQPWLMSLLAEREIDCRVSGVNKGRLVVDAASLQCYAKRQCRQQPQAALYSILHM